MRCWLCGHHNPNAEIGICQDADACSTRSRVIPRPPTAPATPVVAETPAEVVDLDAPEADMTWLYQLAARARAWLNNGRKDAA
ncbi:hypothetical protein D5S17_32860 [Pseudonocardiaceae bacterium YIM PH 21723]|nr:hypothetical protein D5S17_32860 [Pseudonocardiaceae bacterium YIM PH 21723]